MVKEKSYLIRIFVLMFCFLMLAGCGDNRSVNVEYNICSKEYQCDSSAMGAAATPVHFYMPEKHNAMVISFITSETFGFTSDISEALFSEFPKPFAAEYFINTEMFDLASMAMSAIEMGIDVAVLQYSVNDKKGVMRTIAEDITGYQAGHYYYTAYDAQNTILFSGLLPEGKTTLTLSANVNRIDIYSYIDAESNNYFPNGTMPGTVAYENAYEIENIPNNIDISEIVKYEDLDIYDKAKEIGYEVFEIDASYYGYALSFVLDNSSSILVYDKKQGWANILFSGKAVTPNETEVYFADLIASYGDGEVDVRDDNGHWRISDAHKKELINLLLNYKSDGIIAFADLYAEGKGYLDGELKSLVDELGLTVKVSRIQNDEMMYIFYFFDNNNRMAYFTAIYSEADFRPSEKASAFIGWDNGESLGTPLGRCNFYIDYVDVNNKLNVEPERIQQLSSFFTSNDK